MLKIAYSKPDKWFVAKSVKEGKNYEYFIYIFRKIIKQINARIKVIKKEIYNKSSYLKQMKLGSFTFHLTLLYCTVYPY